MTVKRTASWIASAILALAVLVVGGTFLYIHVVEGPAPKKLALSPAAPAPAGNAPLDGTWGVTTGSQAGYRVGEVLFGQNNTAVGRTRSITGSITFSGSSVTTGAITADLRAVSSDQSQRDRQFQHRIMDTSRYPTATFTLTRPVTFTPPSGSATVTATATGNMTLHGSTRSVTFTITARRSGDQLQVLGVLPILFADWGIPNPSLAGFVTTQDHGVLEFLLDFAKGPGQEPSTPATTAGNGFGGGPPTLSPTTTPPLGFNVGG